MLFWAPYVGVLLGVVCAWIYLKRSTMPVAVSSWRGAKVAEGHCPKEHCGGSCAMVGTDGSSTLWTCGECRSSYLLSSIPGE